jgi:CAAX prenyl protease-like protein
MLDRRKLAAYVAPMLLFGALLGVNNLLKKIDGSIWLSSSEYWIYPAQTVLCGALLVWFWRQYRLRWPAQPGYGLTIAILVFVVWIAPQAFLGFPARNAGFNPNIFANQSTLYGLTVILRFLRLVLVVPLMEEIFWRGFLLRYLIDENFDRVPFGTFSWFSFALVTFGFGFAHSMSDWPAALLTGMLYNTVAYRTKSLSTCVLTHALTNLLLGLWIMKTGQWGFW